MKLTIDTTNNLETFIKVDDKVLTKTYLAPRDQNVLICIKEILTHHQIELSEITEIVVNPGPGSFTGTRVGVAIANALGFALNIPVNNQSTPVTPNYSEDPHITTPKKPY
jgi:tRNA A37 threonylcarbamoyladenosine modification protein TsaB